MKYSALLIAAVLGLITTACNKENDSTGLNTQTPISITATYGDPDTRVLYTESGSTISAKWQSGDQIYVVYNDHVNTLTLTEGAGTGSAIFSGSITGTPKASSVLSCYVKDQNNTGALTIDGDGDLVYSNSAFFLQDGTVAGAAKCNTYTGMTTYGTGENLRVAFGVNTSIMKFALPFLGMSDTGKVSNLSYKSGETEVCKASFTVASGRNIVYMAIPSGSYSGIQKLVYTCPATGSEQTLELSNTQANFAPGQTYSKAFHNEADIPLTFEAKQAGSTVSFSEIEGGNLQYSTDGENWKDYTWWSTITLANVGDRVSFRGDNSHFSRRDGAEYSSICSCTGQCYVMGDVMSLLYASTYETEYSLPAKAAFACLFMNNTSIYSHPTLPLMLPATTLKDECYYEMFYGCSNLTTAPVLPATTLSMECYSLMFCGCTSLTEAPVLPAEQLVYFCYDGMFWGCTNLNSVTCLATSFPDLECTSNWLNGVAANGTFTKAASMTDWTTGPHGIPSGWTVVNL